MKHTTSKVTTKFYFIGSSLASDCDTEMKGDMQVVPIKMAQVTSFHKNLNEGSHNTAAHRPYEIIFCMINLKEIIWAWGDEKIRDDTYRQLLNVCVDPLEG